MAPSTRNPQPMPRSTRITKRAYPEIPLGLAPLGDKLLMINQKAATFRVCSTVLGIGIHEALQLCDIGGHHRAFNLL
jgi:hypothetical protein